MAPKTLHCPSFWFHLTLHLLCVPQAHLPSFWTLSASSSLSLRALPLRTRVRQLNHILWGAVSHRSTDSPVAFWSSQVCSKAFLPASPFPSLISSLFISKKLANRPGVMTHAFNPNTQEVLAGGSLWVWDWHTLLLFPAMKIQSQWNTFKKKT